MSGAVARAMLLNLVRDRGALAMTFALPVVFFLIFAYIFAGSSGEQLRLEVAVADGIRSEQSRRLLQALGQDDSLLLVTEPDATPDAVRELVRRGTADIGLVLRTGGRPLDRMGGPGAPPLLVVSDPVRGVAVAMLAGRVERAFFEVLPEVSLGGVVDLLDLEYLDLTPEQRARARAGLEERAAEARRTLAAGGEPGRTLPTLLEREDVVGQSGARNHVSYYAGGVAFLFLLFSAMQGAVTLLEERESGILDRLLAGPGGAGVLVDGKFLYLVVQGFVQIGVIFVVAWLGYGVDLPGNLAPWAVTTLAASVAATGFGLLVATSFRTRRQAQTFANVAILVMSALGGSMVPRFFMPPLLQNLGWITPNTWALEAYAGIFWRDEALTRLLLPWAALLATGGLGYLIARRRARALEAI